MEIWKKTWVGVFFSEHSVCDQLRKTSWLAFQSNYVSISCIIFNKLSQAASRNLTGRHTHTRAKVMSDSIELQEQIMNPAVAYNSKINIKYD